MDEYERLKAQKEEMLKRHESAKDKHIASLEAEVANLKTAFAKRKVEFLTIERDLVDVDRERALKADNTRLRELVEYVLEIWEGSMSKPLPEVLDWVKKARAEIAKEGLEKKASSCP